MSSTMTKSKTSKQISCKVRMLDDQELPFYIDPKATGQDLFTIICNFIDLLESDYFGLEYVDSHRNTCWVEMDKPVLKQVTETKFSLCVKFYTPDPGQLEEELTRYLFALQIKRDLSQGTLLCSDNTAALLASYVAQAEIGDYLESYNNNPSYLAGRKFFPHQTNEHEIRIMNFHKNHVGQLPADADLNLLDIARKVELYGIKMHPAKDHEQVNLNLAVAHMGILVFQNITKINTFSWAKIRKLSFKRKKFLIKLQPEGYGYYKDTVEFYFDTRDDCKNFWKKCIEYHAFFRCVTIKRPARSRSRILTRGSSFRYQGRTQKEILEYAREHYSKSRSFTRSYSNTRTVAPSTGRSHRSPASALKTSDTMRSQETNISSNESARHATRSNINPTTIITTDVQPNDVYHHVYHDDSSTHGSRTLDSRFSRDKYDLSDEDDDDEEETNQHKHEDKTQSNEHETEKPVNGSLVTDQPLTDTIPQTIPDDDDNTNNNTTTTKLVTENETETHFVSKDVIGSSEFDKGKSPGDDEQHINKMISNEEEEEEDYSESNHKIENRVSLEIYHNNQNENKTKDIHENDSAKRYSASLKMYLNARHSSGGSHSICIASNILNLRSKHQNESYKENDEENEQQQQPEIPIVRRSHSLELQRTLSEDITHSPSNSSTPSSPLEIPPVERLIGSNKPMETYTNDNRTPPVVIEIRAKPHSLPRMTNYIEYIDRRTLPSVNSLSWQDDTIENDQNMPLNENESPEDLMELARQLIESLVTKIVEEERQFYKTVDRLVEQACSRALNLYLMERRAQLFSGSPRLPHHKSCILKSINTDKDSDNNIHNHNQDVNNLASRLRTKSSPVIRSSTTTTDWTDVSRKLAAQTCFAAYPSGSNLHELNRSDFSTFSEAKLKFFNIVTTDVLPSQSSLSLPAHLPLSTSAPNALSSSSSTRSSRASSVSSYASSMHVPCLPVLDNQLKRHQRPLSARLLDFSDDSDSNPTTSISTSLKTCILPTTTVTTHTTTTAPESPPHTNNPLPPPPLRTQRRLHQQQKRRSSEDLNSSSDDSLSHHLNKAAGFRSVFPQRNNPYK